MRVKCSITFFNYLCHLMKKEYPAEMTVSEFVEVMTDVLHAGGIDHLEYGVGVVLAVNRSIIWRDCLSDCRQNTVWCMRLRWWKISTPVILTYPRSASTRTLQNWPR